MEKEKVSGQKVKSSSVGLHEGFKNVAGVLEEALEIRKKCPPQCLIPESTDQDSPFVGGLKRLGIFFEKPTHEDPGAYAVCLTVLTLAELGSRVTRGRKPATKPQQKA